MKLLTIVWRRALAAIMIITSFPLLSQTIISSDKPDAVVSIASGFAGGGIVISTQPLSGKICKGGSYSPILIVTGGTSSISYQWQYSSNGTSGWTSVTNDLPGKAIYNNPGSPNLFTVKGDIAEGTYYFRCIVSTAKSEIVSKIAVLIIEPDPLITIQPIDATICVEEVTYNPFIAATGGTLSLNYQWQYSGNGFSGWFNVTNGTPNNAIYTNYNSPDLFSVKGNLPAGDHYFRCVVKTSGNDCHSVTSLNGVLKVIPVPVISLQPVSVTICAGGSYKPVINVIKVKEVSNKYQWQFSPDGKSGWANVVNGVPANSFYSYAYSAGAFTVTGQIPLGKYYYRCVVYTNSCNDIYSNTATLTISDKLNVITQPVNATVCKGGTYVPSVAIDGVYSTLNYQWQYSKDGITAWANTAIGTPANSTYSKSNTNLLYVSGNIAEGKYYYRCIISFGVNGCTAISNNGTLTIVSDPEITTQPTDSTICEEGVYSNYIPLSNGELTQTYQWQFSANGTTDWNYAMINTPPNAHYFKSNWNHFSVYGKIAPGKYYYRYLLSSNASGCGIAVSNKATLTIVADPNITTQPSSASICTGGSYSPTLSATGGISSLGYQWQYSANGTDGWLPVTSGLPGNSNYNHPFSATSFSVSGNLNPGTSYYRCLVHADENGCTDAYTNTVVLTVTADPFITEQPLDATIKVGGTYTPQVNASGGTPSLNAQWQYSVNGSSGWANVANGFPANSEYSNSTSLSNFLVKGSIAPGTYFYRCIVSSSGIGCNSVNSNVAKLTVIKAMMTQRNSNIPEDRIVDWTKAGMNTGFPVPANTINVLDLGAIPDGITPVDKEVKEAITAAQGTLTKVFFPTGIYLFKESLVLSDNIVIEGEGAVKTKLIFDCSQEVDAISVSGKATSTQTELKADALFKSNTAVVADASLFSIGQMVYLNADDNGLVFSDWAKGTVGQLLDITDIKSDTLVFSSELRKDFLLSDPPTIRLIQPIEGVGIKCIAIERLDTTISNLSNIAFTYARNCYVSNLESELCNFSHLRTEWSSHININRSYFHNALSYGDGGRGYGICFMSASSDNRAENNIFDHLRHSMLLQSGANGNVFAYNYSRDPFWTDTSLPANSSGDMLCHGNYPFANLFEGNICQNIVIDNSHGINGPLNTFFRNRAENYGIFMNTSPASDKQNFIGNEITTTLPFVGFLLQGNDHYSYGNNVKGTPTPSNTNDLSVGTLCYKSLPDYLSSYTFPLIGYPTPFKSGVNPAYLRYQKALELTSCEGVLTGIKTSLNTETQLVLYPNPATDNISFDEALLKSGPADIYIYNSIGKLIISINNTIVNKLNISDLSNDVYIVKLINKSGSFTGKFIKLQ